MGRIISQDKLNVSSEEKVYQFLRMFDCLLFVFIEQVYEAVMKWVDVDSNNRCSDLPLLLENVRLPFISQEYLSNHVQRNGLIQANLSCQ